MLKKTIKYTDFTGEDHEEDFYFHLTKAEVAVLELSTDGGLSVALKDMVESGNGELIINTFQKIVLGSYGKRSADGRRFIKNPEIREEFASSEAYSEFFMALITDTDAMVEFANGIMPQSIKEEATKIAAADLTVVPNEPENGSLIPTITAAEMVAMSTEAFTQAKIDIEAGKLKVVDPIV